MNWSPKSESDWPAQSRPKSRRTDGGFGSGGGPPDGGVPMLVVMRRTPA
ncbi:hypothetical protein [Nonomuraea recticatena]